jgi:non-heme chloroperoxidase
MSRLSSSLQTAWQQHLRIVIAIVKKDIIGLLPLVLLGCAVFLIQPVISSLDTLALANDAEFLLMVQTNFYWLGFFIACLLMISVLQQDPADSLTHDWLARPIPRTDWMLAKLLFMVITIVLPVILGRFIIYLNQGHDILQALSFAAAVEKLPAVLVIPLLFAAGLLTPGLRRTILLLVLVVFIFLMPAWSVTRPLLELMGIELGAEFDGMMWLQALPVLLAGVAGLLAVYWYLYCQRQHRRAKLAFAVSVALVFFTVYPPMWLYNWDTAIGIHRSLINSADESLERYVQLEPVQACFPATSVDSQSGSTIDNELLMNAGWPEQVLRSAGPGAVTFSTTTRTRDMLAEWLPSSVAGREIGVDWRLDRIRAQAVIKAGSLAQDITLSRSSTAANRFAPSSSVDTDYWLIPGDVVSQVAGDDSVALEITYDMSLLSPVSYELPVDGRFYRYPELGVCRAELDINANSIDVECTKRGEQAALISAQFVGLDASRVDSYFRADFAPGWLEFIGRKQTRMTLNSPSLVDSSKVLVTAYNIERVVNRQLVSNGLTDDQVALCDLPSEDLMLSMQQSSWRDSSPHEVSSVAVEPGVRVEVLDWRNTERPDAPTLLLLPGLGATAHSYDELAVKLSASYNVVAMTRRGTGASSKPDRGYNIERLSQDVLQVMDTLGISSAILVGHSIAGEELSYLGANHAERFVGLIYLDASYDRVTGSDVLDRKHYRELNAVLPSQPPVRLSESVSYEALKQYALRTTGRAILPPEGEILASYDLATGANRHNSLYLDAIMMGLQAPDYARITVPALAIYAVPSSPAALMEGWYPVNDPVIEKAVAELYQIDSQRKAAEMARFDNEVPDSEALAIEDGDHWIFLSHEQEVLAAIESFMNKVVTPAIWAPFL